MKFRATERIAFGYVAPEYVTGRRCPFPLGSMLRRIWQRAEKRLAEQMIGAPVGFIRFEAGDVTTAFSAT